MTSRGQRPPAPVRVVWSTDMLAYDFGHGHPMTSERVELTIRLAEDLGLLDGGGVELVDAPPASDALLTTVHEPAYVAAVRAASEHGTPDPARGLGTSDDPVFPSMHEAAARVVTGTVDAALAVWEGRAEHAVNVTGGLHHAMPGAASGFCVYNDAAVAIRALLAAGAERVAYVDVDAHHGDGVQTVFWDDPRVLTVSVHETGAALFPGTGFAQEVGGPGATGSVVNVALPAGTDDTGWLRAIEAVVPAVVREFAPDVLVTQHGCDSHLMDPLTHLRVSVDGQRAAADLLHDLAHEAAHGRWVALGGGGYAVLDVVPRSWAHLLGVATHRPVDPSTDVPQGWRELVRDRYGRLGPARMTDGRPLRLRPWSAGYDPADDVDRAIRATRSAVFPSWGLDPDLD
ncbi:acetoin utilization protein AcuC [Cellulomonas fimi]|uniref:Acetoin utilization protein AcuC n=1 Tax=Cellulomonas fimi (strain ATCC 484 / DSM 20113 / JCM 1341 / CCUG 24087 / LMG 16345 / NBRC 15513 / NCIMB 8980 / NCTC 7547 / NRS-133) TaxID=590998 RepID=F4H0Q7_CELFA|nr:acetoin utilization protein AcuC [Cellulomonas fimi]AEE45030.1 Histone deacetylase [Cellulomonas fimi ATCC 484]NNH07995.1 acetoin utilization protein AcuC [Cellulomonas fimi]VEH28026.1 Acetoin utilization protein AcuC [Cellulomonas fimi]